MSGRLTDQIILEAKPKEKLWKLSDGKSLYVLVHPNGGKYWRMKFSFDGKENQMSFGVYPDVSIEKARAKAKEARELVNDGINPSGLGKGKKIMREGFIPQDFLDEMEKLKKENYELKQKLKK